MTAATLAGIREDELGADAMDRSSSIPFSG
jgi:hypothetical protein